MSARCRVAPPHPTPLPQGFPSSALREISILLELQHDNIVRLREVLRDTSAAAAASAAGGGDAGPSAASSVQLYLVFDFCDMDLHKLMEANPLLGANQRLIKVRTGGTCRGGV